MIGPDHTQGTVASEASGRRAVRIASGQHVEFTLHAPANAITVVYNLPDGASGTLSVYAGGQKLDRRLDVTSRYAYFDAPWIAGSKTHHFFNHGRLLLGRDLAAGDTVTLQVDPKDTAGEHTIDSVDFEQVAAPASPPPGALDVTALGADPSGQADSTQAFLQPFFPLSGTITVDGNTLVRTGAMNPNGNHPMSALRVDPYNRPIEADVRITNTTVLDSPWSAFQFVSGSGAGLAADNVTIDGATVRNVGTVVLQAETTGSATISDVTATGVGVTGVSNCPYPTGIAPMRLDDGGGNSGWDGEWTDCSTWPQPGDTSGEPDPDRDLAADRPVLGAPTEVGRVGPKLPPPAAWETRSPTLTIRGGDQPGSLTDLVASRPCTFDPARGSEVTGTPPGSTEV
ncbi:hypothetical protein [Streptomyces sp. PT12]|uniref:hypothetical protein n=1 Tax=Streptomyces sp. PT12 TaxID=1510197 RepID=UPI00215C40CB|nr:hypothetical protein [Streptomyces sp. PT12]